MTLTEELKDVKKDAEQKLSSNFRTPICELTGGDSRSSDYLLVKLSDAFPTLAFSSEQIENSEGIVIYAKFKSPEDASLGEINLEAITDLVNEILSDPALPDDILPYNPDETE